MMLTDSIATMTNNLRDKQYSSTELTKAYLQQIDKLNPSLNCYITVNKQQALQEAAAADKLLAKGNTHPLTGIPLAHKDLFCTQGVKTSCGSKMLDNFVSPYDATLIKHFKAAGAVMLGKTNMDEFAMGSSNENSYYGPVKNPWNTNTVPGGSSGGSAVAVAAHLCAGATGTDTGGSIRQPAALCGITGLKPTYGRVSRYGMVAFASSLDQAGPMAKSAEDTALLLHTMAGFDTNDSTSVDKPVPNYADSLNDSLKGVTIGLPKEYINDQLDKDIANCIEPAIAELEKLGATFKVISLPHSPLSIPAYYIIAPAECSSNLSRFDGVRYGYRAENPTSLLDLYTRSRGEGFGAEVKRRIMVGTYALSAGYFDAYYVKAQKIRQLISQDFKQALSEVDVILGPTSPEVAFELGSKANDPIKLYQTDIYTIAVNLAGLPAISLPAGFVNKLPVGMQLIGNYFEEGRLLNIAHQYQQVTDWHKARPEQIKP